jgi:hypothetical protein
VVKNGAVPDDHLVIIAELGDGWAERVVTASGGTIRLAKPAAAAWARMKDAVAAAGLGELRPIQPAGGYRSLAVQDSMAEHGADWNLASGVTLAKSGRSTHGLGFNVDVFGIVDRRSALRKWIDAHGPEYGFTHRDADGDPCCLHHDGVTAASSDITPIGPEEDDMYTDADRARDMRTAALIENIRALPSTQAGFRQLIDLHYRELLGRSVGQGDDTALDQLNSGMSETGLIAWIKRSDEYRQKHQTP